MHKKSAAARRIPCPIQFNPAQVPSLHPQSRTRKMHFCHFHTRFLSKVSHLLHHTLSLSLVESSSTRPPVRPSVAPAINLRRRPFPACLAYGACSVYSGVYSAISYTFCAIFYIGFSAAAQDTFRKTKS